MKYYKINSMNQSIRRDAAQFVAQAEHVYSQQIFAVAQQLLENRSRKPIILISGPSGSGKTTTALRIEQLLDSWGCETHTISMDNYFLPYGSGPMPLDEQGNVDLESPKRLDAELLSKHLTRLFNYEPVEVPIFDFTTQTRTGTIPLHRKKDELIILEGIHALNPAVTGQTDETATCIYVSVRTRAEHPSGALLHPSKIRLARRLIRNKLFRGRDFDDTLASFRSVSRGENLFIMPYKYRAKFDIDTFFPSELAVYRPFLLSELEAIGGKTGDLAEIREFLEQVESVDADLVPKNSLLREFIGGGTFN